VIEQLIIGVCGIASVWLVNDPREHWRRWACVIGLAAQPFLMFATFKAAQWGIFALSFVYAIGWLRGVRHYWIRSAA
jgi:hypothetical protein